MIVNLDNFKSFVVGKHDKNFIMPKTHEKYYTDLIQYFNNCGTLDSSKGLFICGSVGVGKSYSLQIMQKIYQNFKFVHTRHVVRDYIESGVGVINIYGKNSFEKNQFGANKMDKPITICFDDLGLEETNAKVYGNQANVIGEVLLDRYDLFVSHGMKTFCTSNIAPNKIKEIYGERLADRMVEMMNIITITGESLRK